MDKTKQKIQELVPEIMELKFGCQIKSKNKNEAYKMDLTYGIVISDDITLMDTFETKGHREVKTSFVWGNKDTLFEILGRPITLADVLLAIGQSKEYYTGIDATGEFIQAGEFGGMNRTNIMWDLTKTYDDQSQETKDFIGSILGIN